MRPARSSIRFVLLALVLLAGGGCGREAAPAQPPAAQAEPPAEKPVPTKTDCSYCSMAKYGGETRCMDLQDGPCGNERVGSCMHLNAYCASSCCADAGR